MAHLDFRLLFVFFLFPDDGEDGDVVFLGFFRSLKQMREDDAWSSSSF